MTYEANQYEKLSIALKYYLIGKGYNLALEALRFAKQKHAGKRKDGVTPEVQHQIEIALYLTTLKGIREEENTIIVALLHDIIEDTDTSREAVDARFGKSIGDSVWAISKKVNGVEKYPYESGILVYYDDCAKDLRASVVKPADRIHNNNSMAGVFSTKKQVDYVKEVEMHFLPMIKKAEGLFPDQFMAYMNAKSILISQARFVKTLSVNGN